MMILGSLILLLLVLFLNQWTLEPIVHLPNGQTSLLRLFLIWLFDITLITTSIFMIVKRKTISLKPKKILFSIVLVFFMVMFTECILQTMVHLSPRLGQLISPTAITPMIPDEVLGHRPNPAFPGHDQRGFRNEYALSNADIVAIGDSQTYGTGVNTFQAWPQQLCRLSGHSVYNMSCGGYGSVEGLMLLKTETLQLNPKLIIFAMYNGNDLVDAFNAVYNLNLCESLKSTDPLLQEKISKLEQQEPLIPKIREITSQMWGGDSAQDKTETAARSKTGLFTQIKKFKLFRFFFSLEGVIQAIFVDIREYHWKTMRATHHDSDIYEFFETKDFKTIFTPAYRALGTNYNDPRINEGLQITLAALQKMKKITSEHSIAFLVLVIPTKETVFREYFAGKQLAFPKTSSMLIDNEEMIRQRTLDFLMDHEIDYIDTLPVLTRCFDHQLQPYFVDADGHLNPVGQKAVAEEVFRYLQNTYKEE